MGIPAYAPEHYFPASLAPRDGTVFIARIATTDPMMPTYDVPVFWQSGSFHFVHDKDWFLSARPAFFLWRPTHGGD